MKTKFGLDLGLIISDIISNKSKEEIIRSFSTHSGGAYSFIDPNFGEQSLVYNFNSKGLEISIAIAEWFCSCKLDIVDCKCCDEAEEEFSDWAEYWETIHEIIELPKSKVLKYHSFLNQPTLF